jgi:hypothetical protein
VQKCFVEKMQSEQCVSGVCGGKYTSTYNNYLFECHESYERFNEVHLTTSMIENKETYSTLNNINEHKIVRYICIFNECNDQNLTDQLTFIIDNYFQLSLMRNAFLSSFNSSYQNSSRPQKPESASSRSTTEDSDQPSRAVKYDQSILFKLLYIYYLFIIDQHFY